MIKFLKKFKEKILIALACSFIGIGTILSNTIETKAYVSDEFTYTISSMIVNNTSVNLDPYTFTINNSTLELNTNSNITNKYVVLCTFVINSTTINLQNFSYGNSTSNSVSQPLYVGFNSGSYTVLFDMAKTRFESYNYNYVYIYNIPNNTILQNVDIILKDDVVTSNYMTSYTSSLQSQYDSLQSEYTAYQNTHAYTNEQYNNLMAQNATLTQQVQSLQSQYDTYVSLHSYTNTQYETLLNNYNNLQTMYNNLQQQYLDLQQEYNRLMYDLSPFNDSIWNNRVGSLNNVAINDLDTTSRNSIISFEGSYLSIYPRDMDYFSGFINGVNNFQFSASCNSIITINEYTAIANFSGSLDNYFYIEFYTDNNLVYSTMNFDNDMDNSNTITFQTPISFNRFILTFVIDSSSSNFYDMSYFKANPGNWEMGYNYAVEQLMPRINDLENGLEQAINQQQVRYAEGYNEGFESRIIHNLCME